MFFGGMTTRLKWPHPGNQNGNRGERWLVGRKTRAAAAAVLAAIPVLMISPVGMAWFSDVPPGAPYAGAVALLAPRPVPLAAPADPAVS